MPSIFANGYRLGVHGETITIVFQESVDNTLLAAQHVHIPTSLALQMANQIIEHVNLQLAKDQTRQ